MSSLLIRNVQLNGNVTNILINGNRFHNLHAPADAVADAGYVCKKGDAVELHVVPAPGADLTLELTSLIPEAVLFTKVFGRKLILPH